ncbi:MAG: GT4 family glycosyltransferase PelF [Desulfurobacteriaceae bacterium]
MAGNPDVLLVAEGTYPYIRGGVSTWIHQLITSLSEFSFGILFLGSRREDYSGIQYEIPKNVLFIKEFYLFDEFNEQDKSEPKALKKNENLLKKLRYLHQQLKRNSTDLPEYFHKKDFFLREIKKEEFLHGKTSWEFICESYMNFAEDLPFVDYFWTVRNIHSPLWKIASIVEEAGNFGLVHSPSTGYAGFLASLIKNSYNSPFILTEHGIYIKERKIDILNSDWIQDRRFFYQKEYGEIDHLREMWINFFIDLGKITYKAASTIISLFEDARKVQISLGAPIEKTKVIPNGVKIEVYEKARKNQDRLPVIALIGRVVPIKDIKTFIKAMRIVVDRNSSVEGWIIGPTDEDPDYFEECKKLIEVLNLENNIKFLGFQRTSDILGKFKLTTLTSISEGMPLVILESFAAGIPCVATDVGSCRQLIYGGLNEEDRKLGRAGRIATVANPGDVAKGYLELLENEDEWQKCSRVAFERVSRFYRFEMFINSYRKLYKDFLNGRHIF